MKRTALLVLANIALIACTETNPTTSPTRPKLSAETSDGAHGGNTHFFFLPPLVANPSFSGVSNPFLAPDVQICPLLPPSNTICDPTAPTITLQAPMPKGKGEEYHVDWNSDRSTVGKTYRITVQVKQDELGLEHPLGHTDAQPNGRTLPIRFRIERGALCEAGFACAQFLVTQQLGGTFITDDGHAGAMFPAGALPPGVNSVQLTIERIPHTAFAPATGPLPTGLQQFPFFFDFSVNPDVKFVKPVLLGVCQLENPEDPYFPATQPHGQLVLAHPTGPNTIEFLPRDEAPFIVEGCPGTGLAPAPRGAGLGSVNGARRWIARGGQPGLLGRLSALADWLFMPKKVLATTAVAHGGLGGSLLGPLGSPVNAVLVEMRNNSRGSQQALAGNNCHSDGPCEPPSVIIRGFNGAAQAGVPVTFRVTAGGGTISAGDRSGTSITVNTDEGGVASLDSWTLGTTPGLNTVSATAGVSGSPVIFFATTMSGGGL